MAFIGTQLDEIGSWCLKNPEWEAIRQEARRAYFAADDPRPVHYWPGAGDSVSRQRRFLGWFLFSFRLPDGTRPVEHAVNHLYVGSRRADALQAVQHSRYVLAIVTSVVWGRAVFLELEDERFEVRSAQWSYVVTRGKTIIAHLIPSYGQRVWIPGPGWLEWPIEIGPTMRRTLKTFQLDPLAVERVLQSREDPDHDKQSQQYPQDASLEAAVARMTEAAQQEGRSELVLSAQQWTDLVLQHMLGQTDTGAFAQEVMRRAGAVTQVDELNRWLGLALNIWNTMPQPDRGGRSAQDILAAEQARRSQRS